MQGLFHALGGGLGDGLGDGLGVATYAGLSLATGLPVLVGVAWLLRRKLGFT